MTSESEITEALSKKFAQMDLQKKLDETCKGVECLKVDTTKKLDDTMKKLDELSTNVQNLKTKVESRFKCDKCGHSSLEVGDSFCGNCGQAVEVWDELPNWMNYNLRIGRRGK